MESILGIEFDNAGTLWACDEAMGKMRQLNPLTGLNISNFSSMSLNQSFPSELDFSNNQMYGMAIGNETRSTTTTFYKVELTTGVSYTLFTLNDTYFGLAGANN